MRWNWEIVFSIRYKLKVPKNVNHDDRHHSWRHHPPTGFPEYIGDETEHELDVLAHPVCPINVAECVQLEDSQNENNKSCSVEIHELKNWLTSL